MLDVIHFYFETENSFFSEEHMKSSSKIKEALYEDMYGRTYKYKFVEKKSGRGGNPTAAEDYMDDGFIESMDEPPVRPFDPLAPETIPYTPVTKLNENAANPYEGLLDAPLG